MGHAVAMVMRLGAVIGMVVPMIVVDVTVRVPVHDPVGVGVRVRVGVAGRAGFGPFRHAVRFGPNVGKARLTALKEICDGCRPQEEYA